MPKLASVLKSQSKTPPKLVKSKRTGPLWQGPEAVGPMGGVTQSMIGRFLQCRERFRITYIEGLRPTPVFYAPIEFGNMWHVCEEALAKSTRPVSHDDIISIFRPVLGEYCRKIARKYSTTQEQVDHWYNVVLTQFPYYVEYWKKHPDVKDRTPLFQEQTFDVPYTLPSGRIVRLRGKWDSVDIIGKGKGAGIYLQENKTKSRIEELKLKRQLTFDLQTMLYLVALIYHCDEEGLPNQGPILGVRYNVVRRDCPIQRHKATDGSKCPKCSGTKVVKGSLCQKCLGVGRINPKPQETKEDYYNRLAEDYFATEPEQWFMRWKSEVTTDDIERFKRECLDPILENICWWYDEQTNPQNCSNYSYPPSNWRHPFGIRNILDEGGSSDLDSYLDTGSTVGLERVDTLFEELQ